MGTSIGNLNVILSANSAAFTAGIKAAEGAIASLKSDVAKLASVIGAGLGVKWGLEVAAQAEQTKTSFEVMLGSAEAAEKMFGDLQKMAASTPFGQQSINKAAQSLLTYGAAASDVTTLLRVIGDAASAAPDGMEVGLERIIRALGQIKSKGKLSAQEMLQLSEAGIAAWDMVAKKAGVSVAEIQKLTEQGSVDAGFAIEAILEGLQSKFGGMMARQAMTLNGLWSTLKDHAGMALGGIVEEFVKALNIKGGMAGLADMLGEAAAGAREFAASLARGVAVLVEIGAAVRDVFTAIAGPIFNAATEALSGMFAAGTTSAMSWRDITIKALQSVMGFAGQLADTFTLVFAAVESGWTSFLRNFLQGVITIAKELNAWNVFQSEAERDKRFGSLNNARILVDRQHGDAGAAFQRIREQVEGGRGPMRAKVDEFFDDLSKSQALKATTAEAERLNAAWRDTAKALFGWVDPGTKKLQDLAFVARDIAGNMRGFGAEFLEGAIKGAQSGMRQIDDLLSRVKSELDDRVPTPGAAARGSDAAYSILVQAQMGGRGNPQERMADAIDRVDKSIQRQEKIDREIRDAIKQAGILKVADDNFGG